MVNYLLDIQSLTKALESLSVLTGLQYSLYDDQLLQIISPVKEDVLLTFLKSDKRGQWLYNSFIDAQLRLSLKRNNPFIVRRHTGQHHIFIPLHYRDLRLVAVGEAFYISAHDFIKFYQENSRKFALEEKGMEGWLKKITVKPAGKIGGMLQSIRSLIENVIVSGYERNDLGRKWRCSKTIASLMANMDSQATEQDICKTVVDAVTFLFNADTAAVLSRKNGYFHTDVAAGRLREVLYRSEFFRHNQFLSRALSSGEPVSVLDGRELRYSGLPEEIVSMYLFPLSSGLLGVFNSLLDTEAFNAVHELCMFSSFLSGIKHQKEEYEKESVAMGQVSERIFKLYSQYREPAHLYDSIVSDASSLVDAEKCSLMMPEYDENMLRVFSVKGINRWLMGTVRVRPGEGIAGKVFETGEPILTDRKEGIDEHLTASKPRYRTQSSVSLPLKVANETIGVLNITDKNSGEPFSEKDLSVLNQYVSQVSILLRLCDYYERSEQMRELSMTDPLTGLFNRRYLNIRLEEEYQRARRYGQPISLVILDIDNFKLFNDTEGHLAGDFMLKEISSIMMATVRANDILVRFGGEEFVILMPQTSKEEAMRVSERIRANVREQITPSWTKFPGKEITISAGIAMSPDCQGPKDNLLRCADSALYKAKSKGKDRVCIWDENDPAFEEGRNAQ